MKNKKEELKKNGRQKSPEDSIVVAVDAVCSLMAICRQIKGKSLVCMHNINNLVFKRQQPQA